MNEKNIFVVVLIRSKTSLRCNQMNNFMMSFRSNQKTIAGSRMNF